MLIMKKINVTDPIALHMLSCSGIRFPCLIALTPLLYINIIAMIKLQKMSLPNPDGLSLEEVILIFLFVSCCRVRSESCAASGSKACREKLRRDRLNDKFVELGAILEPGRPAKTDKAAILIDAVRMVTQLRGEAQKLKDTNQGLQEKIKELKAEKNELRDEKQRLKAEKEKLEQQLKSLNAQPSFMPPPAAMPAAFAAQGQAHGNKLVPFISYPGVAMWQFMPPAAVDTSQDHVLRPPVA
ncbi:Transcription factor ILR3 isoform B [Glycine soja]|uniref:Transcription factor ILR3 isoform B n=1 Tax=Glycine soja TaxID=3848 RepID=A0A445KFD8_GLYSO|nr:Transcription factor ILR3 isoform B [Glycine soja]